MTTEADTCRKFVVLKLQAAGWDSDPHSIAEQRSFTDGRIVVRGTKAERKKWKRADHLLRYLSALQAEVDALKRLQAESRRSLHPTLAALLPALLDRAFKGEL